MSARRPEWGVHISARVDYVTRALLVLAASPAGQPVNAGHIASQQGMPAKFIENMLVDLKRSGLVNSVRGSAGGFRLARPADQVTIADVIRAVEGPLAAVRGLPPEEVTYPGPAAHLQDVWIAVRASLRNVLERVTLADVIAGPLPADIAELLSAPQAWQRRPEGKADTGPR